MLAPAERDWMHFASISSLQYFEQVKLNQIAQIIAFVIPDERFKKLFNPSRLAGEFNLLNDLLYDHKELLANRT